MLKLSLSAGPSQPLGAVPVPSAMVETMSPISRRSSSSGWSLNSTEFVLPCPIHSQPSSLPASTMRGYCPQTSELSATVPLTPWRSITSIMRQMPTRTPKSRHE